MEIEQIQAIDTMCRPFYCFPEAAKRLFEFNEYKIMAATTFAGLVKRRGLKPGEEWRVLETHSSVKDMVAEMDEAGVEYVFFDQLIMWSRYESKLMTAATIEEIGKMIEESNGRVVGGASYNPFRIRESLVAIERAVKDYGFKYVWFHPMTFGILPSDKKCYPLYEKCIELGIPCCYQTGQSAERLTSEPGRPMYGDEIALDFPELTLVLTHTGWPWVGEWISLLWRHPNVYGNIGAYMPSDLDPAQVKFMDGRGRDKVLWATNGLGFARCKEQFLELPIRDEAKVKILRENALKIFKL